jgi:tRNA nucleotidyltransferase (CCA-adding enzyme)
MPDYIYLLKNRLNIHQRSALEHIRVAAREEGMTVFLVGGAVRDLTSGSPVFDLDVTVQGNALNLKKPLENAGGKCWGEHEPSRTLFFRFPVGVTVEISSARREEYPKPGKPVYQWDTILEDLRRRDFTANAMALSLNEHSYGLLMDPLNGVADIEARHLRLVSNYGFIEDPSRLLRATRLVARLGWELDERTRTRYQNAKEENSIEALSSYHKGYELEEIGHEEDGLRVLTAMETEGWMQHLFPAWTIASADATALEEMRKLVTQLQMQGVSPDISAPSMQYLTAKMPAKDLAALKAMFVRPGFVEEWNNLDNAAREFNKLLTGKEASTASATWKLFTSADPQAVLWLGLTSKSPAVKEKYKNFFTVWPEARQKIPHALLQELRITPELPGYDEMIGRLFLGVIDQELETEEQLRAFLEPYSPPAPPPPVTVRRTRGSRKGAEKKIPVEVPFDGDGDADPEVEVDADTDTEALELDDEEVAEDAVDEIEDDDDSEISLPPVVKKIVPAPKKSVPEAASSQNGKPAPREESSNAVTVVAKAPVAPSLHVVAPAKPAKVHVMARPDNHAPAASTAAPKKALPMKAPAGKAAPAKPVASKPVASKPVASKAPSRPVVKPTVKAAAKNGAHAKKVAAKAPAKLHKKPEPVKKSHPAKKPAPARKHR